MNYIFIDIRKSDEVYSKHLDIKKAENFSVYHFPMNMIKFNRDVIIEHLEYVDEIYLVCHSAKRSKFIKDKYFSEYPKIKVSKELQFSELKTGLNKVTLNDEKIRVNVINPSKFNLYSIMRITQIILGTLILVLGGYTFRQIKNSKKINKIPLIILLLFGLMALINGLTSTCTMSIILQDYLN
jgi:hypothetical protein